jgi:hypothetical protein
MIKFKNKLILGTFVVFSVLGNNIYGTARDASGDEGLSPKGDASLPDDSLNDAEAMQNSLNEELKKRILQKDWSYLEGVE